MKVEAGKEFEKKTIKIKTIKPEIIITEKFSNQF
jgi:uncharacterized protein YggU (UPF0235/DUF167 family)